MKVRDTLLRPPGSAVSQSKTAGPHRDQLWWKSPFRMFQTNIREIDAGLDVERTLDRIVDYGADAWLLSVGGIISNYPSTLTHQSVNPALAERETGDLVGDAVSAASRRGVRVLARMDFSKVARRVAEQHPDWCYIDPAGSRQTYNGLTSACPSGQYYQEKVFEVLSEVLDRYEIDGFFFNWISYNEIDYEKRYRGVCHCMSCRIAFEPALGGALPDGPESPNYVLWQKLSYDALEALLGRVRDFISARRPDAPLVLGETADIVFHEANNEVGRTLWPHNTSEYVSVSRSYRPDVPVLVNSVAFLDMPYRLVSEEPRQFEQYLLQAAARGAIPSTYIMGVPDEFDYAALGAGARITRFHREHQDVYRGLRPSARTAVVRPDALKESSTASSRANATEEFRGTWLALLERHVPFDALPENRLGELASSGALDRYSLLVLPGLGRMDLDTTRKLDDWVNRGGTLLMTGDTGLDDDHSQFDSSGVAVRTATMSTPETTWSSALVGDNSTDTWSSLPILGEFHVVEAKDGTQSALSVLSRAPYGPPEKCYGHIPLDFPARLEFAYGRGRTITLPWTPGRAYRDVGLGAIGDVIASAALDLLGENVDIETDLPSQVEVVLGRSDQGLVIHLRNLTGQRGQSFGDPVTIGAGHRLTLDVGATGEVRALVAGLSLVAERSTTNRGQLTITLPEIGLFEVLVVAGEDGAPD